MCGRTVSPSSANFSGAKVGPKADVAGAELAWTAPRVLRYAPAMRLFCSRWPLIGLVFVLLPVPAPAAPPRPPAPPPDWLPHYDLDIRLDIKGHDAHVRQVVTWTNR